MNRFKRVPILVHSVQLSADSIPFLPVMLKNFIGSRQVLNPEFDSNEIFSKSASKCCVIKDFRITLSENF